MHPIGTSQELLSLNRNDLIKALEGQHTRAMEFLVSGSHTMAKDEDKLLALSQKVFWKSYAKISPEDLATLLRVFPYADRMLAKYGIDNEDAFQVFMDHLCSLLLGVPFEDKHELKDLLERQANHLFDKLNAQRDRMRSFRKPATE